MSVPGWPVVMPSVSQASVELLPSYPAPQAIPHAVLVYAPSTMPSVHGPAAFEGSGTVPTAKL